MSARTETIHWIACDAPGCSSAVGPVGLSVAPTRRKAHDEGWHTTRSETWGLQDWCQRHAPDLPEGTR